MPKSLSFDLRSRVLAAIDEGFSCRQAAARFGVSASSAIRWQALRRLGGDARPKPQGGDRLSQRTERHGDLIRALLVETARHHPAGAEGAAGAVWRAVERRRALALLQASQADAQKKTEHASEQDRPDVLRRREDWFESQLDLDPERLVFIDETWTSTNMARTHGRCARGERLRVGVPHGHWKTTNVVAGLRISGIMAPFVLDGPINRNAFETYVEKVLVRELLPGDIVMMDNLSSHKGPAVRAMIEAVGASLFYLRPTARISTRSRKPSRSSRRICAKPPSEPSPASGTPSVVSSTSSRPQDTMQPERKTR